MSAATVQRLRRAVRFGGVSAASIVVTQALLLGLQLAGVSAVVANALAVTVAAVLTYPASRRWVWTDGGDTGRAREVALFGLTTAVGFALSTGLVWLLVKPGASLLLANALNVAAFGAVWVAKYLVLDLVVFAPPPDARPYGVAEHADGLLDAVVSARRARGRRLWGPRIAYSGLRAADAWGRAALAVAALLMVPVVSVSALAATTVADVGTDRFPGRPGVSESDSEAVLGADITVDGVATTVEGGRLLDGVSDLEDGRYLAVRVTVANQSDEPVTVRRSRWRVRTDVGHIYPAAVTTASDIADRTVAPGGRRQGHLLFEVGDVAGTFYVLHAPDGGDGPRGVWSIVAEP